MQNELNWRRQFIEALETNNLEALRRIPKADLHNHTYLGGNREYICKRTGHEIPLLEEKLRSMDEMHSWVHRNIEPVFEGKAGRLLTIEAAFCQARQDGVSVLEIGADVWENGYFYNGDIDSLIETFKTAHKKYAPQIEFRFQIGMSRHCSIAYLEEWLAPFWERDVFHSIDLSGDELAQPIQNFKGIYRKAKEKGLVLKAHVGEWGDADSVIEAVEELELDEVQHGISAAASASAMYRLADNNIRLNICPTSNVMLDRVESLAVHPIRTLYDYGVKVTVNTDDMLLFNQGVSEEFLNLYRAGLFTADELDVIRENGLG